ncbi:hypothetical protein LF1_02890 [Rubripirellula obstinata]|uniref:Uncharacterized protein n=1 Tax=Rubripirellula obstinata TaxID=406547 RepID=A0A5B1CDG5_9BACT|nr:hypothetical protein [Rubripirellula obstinata]KAA1257799.1 hypothetical protein LF1_02890 [Rubripirellula obstinata]
MISLRAAAISFAFSISCGSLFSNASAQVIQLPTVRTFSYSGPVLVPDSGSAYLGGVNRSAVSSQRRGLSRNFGQANAASGAVVSATIIDLDEMDRQIRRADIQRDAVRRDAQVAKSQE